MTETDTYIQFEIVNVESSTVVWNHRQYYYQGCYIGTHFFKIIIRKNKYNSNIT